MRADFFSLRVVGIRTRWEVRGRVVRNSSIKRSPMPNPIPLPMLVLACQAEVMGPQRVEV